MQPTKQIVALRIGAVLAVVGIALAFYSGVVATPAQEQQPAPASKSASEPRGSGDPSLAGLRIAADAEPGDVEIFY
jgi:hypothetical protein